MAVTIVVTPERLRRAALAVRALGGRLLDVRGQLGASLGGVDGALGDGEARAAFAALWTRWSGSAERLTAAVDELAAALEAAADGYERADRAGAQTRATPPVPGPAVGALQGGRAGPLPTVGALQGGPPPSAGASSGGPSGGGGADAAAW